MSTLRIYNTAGPKSKDLADLHLLMKSRIPVIHIGSITVGPSTGNKEKFFWTDARSGTTINSYGLPNKGLAYYMGILPELIREAHVLKKKVRVSIAGHTKGEYVALTKTLVSVGVDELEINASCPNVAGKTIASFDPVFLGSILNAVTRIAQNVRIDVKLSPYTDSLMMNRVAKIISKHSGITAVVTSNTFPHAYTPEHGSGGMGGTGLHHIALGQVAQLRALLPKRIRIVGVGGIRDEKDIRHFIDAGATEVQVGSAYFQKGVSIFNALS